MKIFRLARLALALTPLSLGLAGITFPHPVVAAPIAAPAANDGLPPGAPPLTAAQKQQQQARIKRFMQDSNALNANTTLTPAQKQQQGLALQQSLQQDMLKILTPKQRAMVMAQNTKVLALRQQFLKQHQADITKQQQLTTALQKSMTAAQKQKIENIKAGAQQQLQSLQTNTKLSVAVKQKMAQGIVGDATRQGMAVLTPTQQSELKEIRALQIKLTNDLDAFAKAHGTP